MTSAREKFQAASQQAPVAAKQSGVGSEFQKCDREMAKIAKKLRLTIEQRANNPSKGPTLTFKLPAHLEYNQLENLRNILASGSLGRRAMHEICADPAIDVKISFSRIDHRITSPRYFFQPKTLYQLTIMISLDQPYSAGATYPDLLEKLEEAKKPAPAPVQAKTPAAQNKGTKPAAKARL